MHSTKINYKSHVMYQRHGKSNAVNLKESYILLCRYILYIMLVKLASDILLSHFKIIMAIFCCTGYFCDLWRGGTLIKHINGLCHHYELWTVLQYNYGVLFWCLWKSYLEASGKEFRLVFAVKGMIQKWVLQLIHHCLLE